jgi:hypothetical protein
MGQIITREHKQSQGRMNTRAPQNELHGFEYYKSVNILKPVINLTVFKNLVHTPEKTHSVCTANTSSAH